MGKSVFYLKRTYIVMRKMLDDRLSAFDLTTSQFEVLGYLSHTEGLEQQQLQICSGITSATLTGILDKLEARGLLVRRSSEADKRAKIVAMTAHGHETFNQLADVLATFEDDMLNGFSPAERALLADWLERIAHNLGDTDYRECE